MIHPLSDMPNEQNTGMNGLLVAMHEKLETLKAKEVYKEVSEIPPGKNAIQCKWVLHIKHNQTDQISSFKGHLVAEGFTQIPG